MLDEADQLILVLGTVLPLQVTLGAVIATFAVPVEGTFPQATVGVAEDELALEEELGAAEDELALDEELGAAEEELALDEELGAATEEELALDEELATAAEEELALEDELALDEELAPPLPQFGLPPVVEKSAYQSGR
jgi:hypothetical protein